MKKQNPWCKAGKTETKTLLFLQIQPRASRNQVVGMHGDRLKIRVTAPPVDGEANEELIRFLSKKLKIPKTQVRSVRGQTGKLKYLICEGITPALAEKLLETRS